MADKFRRSTRQSVAVDDTRYVHNELICFLFNRFSSDTSNNLRKTIFEIYGSDEVGAAKEKLCQEYSSHLGPYTTHKGKLTKTKNVDDMLHGMNIIDLKFCDSFKPGECYAVTLGKLPFFEVDNVMDKVYNIEKMLKELPTRTEIQNIVILNSMPITNKTHQSTPPTTPDMVCHKSEVGPDACATQNSRMSISGNVVGN